MERVLIYQTAYLGDLLLAIPLIKKIRLQFPHAELHLACRAPLGSFFVDNRLVDQIHEVKKANRASVRSFESELLRIHWDAVFCDHQSTRSLILAMRLKTKLRVSFRNWWSAWRFDHTVAYDRSLPDALRQLSLLTPLITGLATEIAKVNVIERRNALRSNQPSQPAIVNALRVPEFASLSLPNRELPPEWSARKNARERWVFIAPGSQWATKRWTMKGFREVALEAFARGDRVIAVGSADERNLIDGLNITNEKFHNLAGQTTLTELLALFQHGSMLISNDSGLMHLASCAQLPTVAIFGPTVLSLGYEPWQNSATVVETDLSCRPCGKHGHDHCPIGSHACMRAIDGQQVIDRSSRLQSLP